MFYIAVSSGTGQVGKGYGCRMLLLLVVVVVVVVVAGVVVVVVVVVGLTCRAMLPFPAGAW